MTRGIVLVTGGTGFLGTHLTAQLLQAGYAVRATLRGLDREGELRQALERAGAGSDVDLELTVADLSADDGWADAVSDVRYVLHVASPFPPAMPKDDDEVIVPARDGALRVLRAARDAGVQRVVMTSSFAAVGYGHAPSDQEFTEKDWTNIDAPLGAYICSKAVAERAAWDFIAAEGGAVEFAVVNPVAFSSYAGMDIGRDNGLVVDLAYEDKAPYSFTGTVKKVVFDLKPATHEDEKALHEHAQVHAIGEGAAG
jgi:nucleoside-diphosphate-sugar epimerase